MNNANIYLCKADCSLLGTITGIQTETCNLVRNATDLWELTFDVSRFVEDDGELVRANYYDSIDDMMRLYLDSEDVQAFFVIDSEPVIKGDNFQETKTVTAHSIECELSNIYLKNFKVNCGTYDSQEYLATDEYNVCYNVNNYTGLPYEYVSLVNYSDPQLSLLHLALQGTGWSVKENLDTDMYLDSDSYFKVLLHTVSDPVDGSYRTVGYAKKKWDESYGVYAVELQKWGSGAIGFIVNGTADVTIIAQSSDKDFAAPIALVYTDGNIQTEHQNITQVSGNTIDSDGTTLTYQGLQAGTYRIISPYDTNTDYNIQIKSIIVDEETIMIDKAGNEETIKVQHIFKASDLTASSDNEEITGICQFKNYFDISNNSIYSFLMKTVSPAASVIFEFDRKTRQVGIVKVNDYGEDTGVFITMRNLMNSFEVTSTSEDNIITKLIPTGANELGIRYVNFGEDYILNLDYFMNTLNEYGDYKYVSTELHDKYNQWKKFRETEEVEYNGESYTRRELYKELTQLYNQTVLDISDIHNMLPNDGCMIDYKTYTLEDLKIAYNAYNNALVILETLYKKEYGATEIGDASDNYTPKPDTATNIKNTPYWYDYYAYKEIIIPKVEEALKMYCETDKNGNLLAKDGHFIELEFGNPDFYADESIVKEVDSYLYEFSLYGLDELESKKKAWSEAANILFEECFILSGDVSNPTSYRTPDDNVKTGWNSLKSEQKSKFTTKEAYINKLNQYLDYMSFDERINSLTKKKGKGIIRQCDDTIAERVSKISALEKKQEDYESTRKSLTESVSMNNFFTGKDLSIINSMIREQDYSNENILITNLDDAVSEIAVQEELYQAAIGKLYEISQPQYSFNTQLDNLYSLDEFKSYQKPFNVGNFIRVGTEIHEELYDNNFIKLRLISITHNPLEISENLSVEFSTMTKSLNGISDLAFLLDNELSSGSRTSSSTSSSGSGTYGNNDVNVQISNNMLNALLSTELFGTAVTDVILDTMKANKGNFNSLFAHSGVFDLLEAGQLKISGDCLVDYIQSNNFVEPPPNTTDGLGSRFDLANGQFESYTAGGNYIINDGSTLKIKMDNFKIDDEGNAEFKGNINGSNGAFIGDMLGSGSIRIMPGYYVPDNFYLQINFEYSDYNSTYDLKIKYYHNTVNGVKLSEKIYKGFYHYDFGPDGGTGNIFTSYYKIPGSKINEYEKEVVSVYSVEVTCQDKSIYSSVTSINIIDNNDNVINSYDDNTIINNNKLFIDTNAGILNGEKLFIDFYNGSIIGDIYIGQDDTGNIGTINFQECMINDSIPLSTSISEIGCKVQANNTQCALSYILENYKNRHLSKASKITTGITLVDEKFNFSYHTYTSGGGEMSLWVENCSMSNHLSPEGMYGQIFKDEEVYRSWYYGEYIQCEKAYQQYSFPNLNKRTLYIGSDGTISASSSSRRYKQNISSELDDYFDPHSIYDLPICQFRYNEKNGGGDNSELHIGFIAEDVAKYYPAAARWNKDHTEVDTWEMSDMFPAVVKLIQEQHSEIELLKEEVKLLKQRKDF